MMKLVKVIGMAVTIDIPAAFPRIYLNGIILATGIMEPLRKVEKPC
jgi:hypothetical protein